MGGSKIFEGKIFKVPRGVHRESQINRQLNFIQTEKID